MPSLLEAQLRTHESPVLPHESLSLFLATLPKSLNFKSFPCHTSEIPPGGLHNWLTRNLESELHPACRERSLRVSPRSSFLHGSQTGSALRSNPTTPLSFHALTNCKFSNFFVLTFIQNGGGVPPSPLFQRLQSSSVATASQRPEVFLSLHTVNFQLLTNLSPTSHQSRVTNNDPATHL